MNHNTTPTTAYGYIRVSTEKQNVEDIALKRQATLVREYCSSHGVSLLGIYEDVGSAALPFSLERRDGLNDVSARAKQDGALLVVPEPTRLFRDEAAARSWLDRYDVPVVSVRDERVLGVEEFLKAVRGGQADAEDRRIATSAALQRKSSKGERLGSPADKRDANRASVRARAFRSDDVVNTIADILRSDPAYRELSHKALADLLNRRNVLTGWGRPWTPAGIRRQRKLAEERIREWEDDEGDASFPVVQDTVSEVTPSVDDDHETRGLPNQGIF